MSEKVFLVHGWSVNETTTYQALHLKLAENGYDLREIYLGRYVTLDDHVEVKDIAAAMHHALIKELGQPPWKTDFHVITHSTGALVAKEWVARHYVGKFAADKSFQNLVFLAGPHFGSRLAHHGRSMISHIKYLGDTGNKVLTALELGSEFSWHINELWLDQTTWKAKGIRPYCLIGDKIYRSFKEKAIFADKVFPAAYEEGSDEVVRVAAGNLNFRRYRMNAVTGKQEFVGDISGVPLAALSEYTHSGEDFGIMNSITRRAKPDQAKYQNLKLILACLEVKTETAYKKIREEFERITGQTRAKRKPFAQLDFRFKDVTGAPIYDYVITLGAIVDGEPKASNTIAHTHKNKVNGNHFTVFLDLRQFEPQLTYFLKFDANTGTDLFSYWPDPYKVKFAGDSLINVIAPDRCSQIDVILDRRSSDNLFVFHTGEELKDHHIKWDRRGTVVDRDLEIKLQVCADYGRSPNPLPFSRIKAVFRA